MSKIKGVAIAACYGFIIGSIISMSVNAMYKRSDSYIRDRVVMLKGDVGGCTGIEVKAASGKIYTLTAGHCKGITTTGVYKATLEDGSEVELKKVAISVKDDLMLLTAASDKSIDIATSIFQHQPIHTMTHGELYPSHRSDGEILEERIIQVAMYPLLTEEDTDQCRKDGNTMGFSFFEGPVCVANLLNLMSTARVRPGSSGGPALNDANQLIGIVSTTEESGISGLVPLRIIQQFMADK